MRTMEFWEDSTDMLAAQLYNIEDIFIPKRVLE